MPRAVRYRVLRKIAHGGMAEIFLALQTGAEGFQKPVVLKRILPAFAADPHFVRMLVDEAHIASSLNHSHLVQVLDLGKSGEQFFLVLEFVDGWSLEQVRRRAQKARIKLPLPLVLYIVGSLCRALSYVHKRTRDGKPLGIVHRDVSPQNVLLGREGEVKLADFGIAKAVGRREKSATGVIKGKFAYMSPEQSIGAELDARSDLFSVGTLLYILTTGRKPFEAATDLEVLMQVRKARYEKPSALVRDFNPEVERFIGRALRADRSRRWQSAEQMADRLDAVLVKLGQPSGPASLKRWLEALSARDGVSPPGDLRTPALDPVVRTIELETGDLELNEGREVELRSPEPAAGPGDATWIPDDDDDDDAVSPPPAHVDAPTHPEPARTRVRAAAAVPSREATTPPPALSSPSSASASSRATAVAAAVSPGDDALLDDDDVPIYEDDPAPQREARHRVEPYQGGPDEVQPDEDEPDEGEQIYIQPLPAEEVSGGPSPVAAPSSAVEAPAAPGLVVASAAEPVAAAPAPEKPSRGPATKPTATARVVRALRRAVAGTLLLALVGGGAYFARPYFPPWLLTRVTRIIMPIDVWLKRLPELMDLEGRPEVSPAPGRVAR